MFVDLGDGVRVEAVFPYPPRFQDRVIQGAVLDLTHFDPTRQRLRCAAFPHQPWSLALLVGLDYLRRHLNYVILVEFLQ